MDIQEKAQKYAQNKMQQVLNDAVAEAYMEGYKQGYRDCQAEIPVECNDGDTEYVDLGLPSGTLWAKDYAKEKANTIFATYEEARKFNIPTVEQLNELYKCCQLDIIKDQVNDCMVAIFTSTNGNSIKLQFEGYLIDTTPNSENEVYFWINTEKDAGLSAYITQIYKNRKPHVKKCSKVINFP